MFRSLIFEMRQIRHAMTTPIRTMVRGLSTPPLSRRQVAPFYVMDVLKRAIEMEQHSKVYHLGVGQPKTGAPRSAVAAAKKALEDGLAMGYTEANGLGSLRQRIATWYLEKHGSIVDADRIAVTTGSSSGFLLAFAALWSSGDAVAVPSTAYPCYRNVLRALECRPVEITSQGFHFPTPEDLERTALQCQRDFGTPLKGLVLSSPANPTGATLSKQQLHDLATACRDLNVRFISDEIYHHITYNDDDEGSASAVDLPGVIVVNSFSKFFSMTGWRIGWLCLPKDEPELHGAVTRLHENLAICAPQISQIAAQAAFHDVDTDLADHVSRYARNRTLILDALETKLRIDPVHVAPANGAFYVYLDLAAYGVTDAIAFSKHLLHDTGIAIGPGADFEFDPKRGATRVRLSYCGVDYNDLHIALDKLNQWWWSNTSSRR